MRHDRDVRDERDVWWRIGHATVGGAFTAGFRLRWSGLHNVPRRGGALVAYNHVSVLDPIPVALAVYELGRVVRFLGVAEAFDQPLVGWGLRRLRQVPLHRGTGDRRAFEDALATIREGGLVGISPEGTVGRGATLLQGNTGAARIALLSGGPVIPVGVWGTQQRWPKEGLRLSRPLRPVAVACFGPSVIPDGDPESRDVVAAMTDRIMAALARQVQQARDAATRARPPTSPS
jgi:1-acyl-sn-glycerol-3-phosphate acyltransferase